MQWDIYKLFITYTHFTLMYTYIHDHEVIIIPKLCGYQEGQFRGFCGLPQFYSGISLSQYVKLGLIHFVTQSFNWLNIKNPNIQRCDPSDRAATRLLGFCFRNLPRTRKFVSCECCVLSGRGPCFGQIILPEESCPEWCVWGWWWRVDNEETLAQQRPLRHGGKKFNRV